MLTSEEKKIMRNLVVTNIGDRNEVEKFDFTLKCSKCTDEEITVLDKLCADPSAKTKIADCIILSLDQLSGDNVQCSDCAELIDILDHVYADPEVKAKITACINRRSQDQSRSDEREELTQMHSEIWVSVRYSCVKEEYQISGECM
jgi:hypothetical protein